MELLTKELNWFFVANINRKLIEDYYESEWKEIASAGTRNLLIELTCQAYKLNKPEVPRFIKDKEPLKPQDLGQI